MFYVLHGCFARLTACFFRKRGGEVLTRTSGSVRLDDGCVEFVLLLDSS